MRVTVELMENQGAFAEGLGPEYDGYKERFALGHLVDIFAGGEMKTRLLEKQQEDATGWQDDREDNIAGYQEALENAVFMGDYVDAANIAMILWNIEQEGDPQLPDHATEEAFPSAVPLSQDDKGHEVRSIDSGIDTA